MIKTKYTMTAVQPLFTGSDEDTGIIRTFRKEKVLLKEQAKIISNFSTENERRMAILNILESVWTAIDFEGMQPMRRMRIWDEFSSKVLAATGVRTRFQFLNELCHAFNIRSLNNEAVTEIIQRFYDDEFLTVIRDELQFLILLLRKKREDIKLKQNKMDAKTNEEKIESEIQYALFKSDIKIKELENDKKTEIPVLIFQKSFERIPYISGNSIRGILRRLVMRDFCNRTGITALDKNMYHQLFTGGNITDSTSFEDITRREEYIAMCPMIGLLGSAIGNMTIEGDLKVGGARPQCQEHGTGEISFWEMLSTDFGTRRDDSKIEDEIEIKNTPGKGIGKEEQKTQMKYGYEILIPGTRLDHQFICIANNPLIESAYWHMLTLFRECPFIGGSSAVGNGEISMDYEITENGNQAYLNYLAENQEKIRSYFDIKNGRF